MFKTCISIPKVGQAPDIINHILDDIGWHVDTIIFEPDKVSFYVRYKWYQYYKVCAFKKAVKDCVNKLKYQSATNTLKWIAGKERVSSEQFTKALSRFAKAGIQGNSEDGDEKELVLRRELK